MEKEKISMSKILLICSSGFLFCWLCILLIPRLEPIRISCGSLAAFIFFTMIISAIICFIKELKNKKKNISEPNNKLNDYSNPNYNNINYNKNIKFCPNCGVGNWVEEVKCPKCGTDLKN